MANDDVKLIKGIAYHQSMSSSHGDVELSLLASELLSSIPKHAWKNLIYKRESRETKDRFKIEIDNSSYSAEALFFDNQMLNFNMGTEYKGTNVELYIVSGPLISNGIEYDRLLKYIEIRKPEDAPLVVLTEHHVDIRVSESLKTLYFKKRKEGVNIAIFSFIVHHPIINDIEAIYATTGYSRQKMMDQEIIFKDMNIDVSYKNGNIYIYNLVQYNEDGTHKDITDPVSPVSILLSTIEEFLSLNKDQRQSSFFSSLPNIAKNISNSIRCEKIGYIVIGGSGYDNMASKDVLEDVLSAARESLTNGVTLGGFKTLAGVLKSVYSIDDYDTNKCNTTISICKHKSSLDEIEYDIANIFYKSIMKMVELLYVNLCPLKHDIENIYTTSELINKTDISFNVVSGEATLFDKKNLKSLNKSLILQPKSTDIEFVKRFGEVAIKFLFTNIVLIPDGVFIKDK
jgi:hypothetical protein